MEPPRPGEAPALIRPPLYGYDIFTGAPWAPPARGALEEKFLWPPFSVFNARDGEWRKRKQAWIELGIKSECGRGDDLIFGHNSGMRTFDYYRLIERGLPVDSAENQGTSIFDPVLAELLYLWFCPPGGQVCDPFAGGSVRGIVAGMTGFRYWGCDLNGEQVAANREQAAAIAPPVIPEWHCADCTAALPAAPPADFIFSCPPYGDLERYSDDPRDLSTLSWVAFRDAYREIIALAVRCLLPNRFACFVVGDFRGPQGYYRELVAETTLAFADAGARLYNTAVLVTAAGTAPMRASRQFPAGGKLCKTHQDVLIFCKGDWRIASALCAPATFKDNGNED